jgi:hypoxanthine phosphoribosyltransferase
LKVEYTSQQIAKRVAEMGREISRTYGDRRVDVVAMLDNAFVFAADLVRHITSPVVCHFVQAELREVHLNGLQRREVFFSYNPELKGRDVLVVDAVLHSGVTLEFFVRRLMEREPRSVRVAVLLDKPEERRVPLQPDYLGFSAASNYLVGYGLPDSEGLYRNLSHIATLDGGGASEGSRSSGPPRRAGSPRRAGKSGGRGRGVRRPAR